MSKPNPDQDDRLCLAHLPLLIWQFTESNFPTFVLPNSGFGLLAALAAPILTSRLEPLRPSDLLLRGLQVVLFNWANVFVFDLANQRLPESIVEDQLNKPWRPILTKQISPESTRRLMLGAIPAVLLISALLGVGTESSFILIVTWLYNDLHGGDEIIRDLLIAIGYGLYLSSSLQIAIGPYHHITEHGYRWIAMMSGIILTTMQVQDLKDQAGDATRGRQTWPLVLGDSVSRWMITGFVLFWSIACAWFWQLPLWGYAVPMCVGLWVGYHVVKKQNDVAAWKYWCVWQVVVYTLPCFVWLQR
ncbi:uncharacterized protein N7477_009785 [Penicillium maclennaniae]|uniref:uncharacterized protein n=1 Tax=Penicillium maclennaniae TaxID=1343394 RepID=UPI002541F87B|nr:uncharacterized protein N7477_009785 [Penicillium maclennaniae]KAJ5662169.1 hypothetical protein N7477_009785 [Penicillium maclennaniae]